MKKLKNKILIGCACMLASSFTGCAPQKQDQKESSWPQAALQNATRQLTLSLDSTGRDGNVRTPVTLTPSGKVYYCSPEDWRSGFYAGSLWYLYELTADTTLLNPAIRHTETLESAKNLTWHHDIGFIINCSFGNALRLTGDRRYAEVMTQAARSLCTRFRPAAGVIQSWDVNGNSWQAKRGWKCPVIIDNMMNLELLFEATKLTGDSTFCRVALSHADRTLKEQFRPDGSCFHVVDYDPQDGTVRSRQTAQGYADSSAWSRGQAWAIYGYTVCYRETGRQIYLDQALKAFNFMKNHPHMPADRVPYWDMDAPGIPNEPRDASSAAVIASALYEISTFDVPQAEEYRTYADSIMSSLTSPDYTAAPGTNGLFLLMHNVGSIPHNSEIDVPLNYADYYYMEALKRRNDIDKASNK